MPTLTQAHLDAMADDPNGVLDVVNFYSKDGIGSQNVHNGRTAIIALHGVNGGSGAREFAKKCVPYTSFTPYVMANAGTVIIEPVSGLGHGSWWHPSKSFDGNMSPADAEVSAAVTAISRIVGILQDDFGMDLSRIILLGHSQGGCLAAEVMFDKVQPYSPVDTLTDLPARFKNVCLMNSGIIGMFMDDQAECEQFAWWSKKVYGQPMFMGSHVLDGTVPEPISRRTAELLHSHCGAIVDYDVSSGSVSGTPPNYHPPHDDHIPAFGAIVTA